MILGFRDNLVATSGLLFDMDKENNLCLSKEHAQIISKTFQY
jgi:hypothetical protein